MRLKRKTGRTGALLTVLLLMVMLLPQQTPAAVRIDTEKAVSLTVDCHYENEPLQGIELTLYKAADVSAEGELVLTEAFAGSGIVLEGLSGSEWQTAADELAAYAARYPESVLPVDSAATDQNGQAHFPSQVAALTAGLYLVTADQLVTETHVYTMSTFLVSLPELNEADEWVYDALAGPKFQVSGQTVDKTVMKVWKDDGYKNQRPEQIEIQLLNDGSVYDTVVLNADNQWQYVWQDLPAAGSWAVQEVSVPSGYTASVTVDGNTYQVVNTYTPPTSTTPGTSSSGRLPQTGMLWWPVPVLAAVGLLLFLIGWSRRQKDGEPDEK